MSVDTKLNWWVKKRTISRKMGLAKRNGHLSFDLTTKELA